MLNVTIANNHLHISNFNRILVDNYIENDDVIFCIFNTTISTNELDISQTIKKKFKLENKNISPELVIITNYMRMQIKSLVEISTVKVYTYIQTSFLTFLSTIRDNYLNKFKEYLLSLMRTIKSVEILKCFRENIRLHLQDNSIVLQEENNEFRFELNLFFINFIHKIFIFPYFILFNKQLKIYEKDNTKIYLIN